MGRSGRGRAGGHELADDGGALRPAIRLCYVQSSDSVNTPGVNVDIVLLDQALDGTDAV